MLLIIKLIIFLKFIVPFIYLYLFTKKKKIIIKTIKNDKNIVFLQRGGVLVAQQTHDLLGEVQILTPLYNKKLQN